MMRFLGCDEKYNLGTCSDFEFFAEWERILPLCAGSVSASLYEKQLSFLKIFCKKKSALRPSAKDLWQLGNEKLDGENKLYFTRKYREMMIKQGIDFFDYVMNISIEQVGRMDAPAPSWESLAEALCSELGERPQLRLEISAKQFCRPDRYHATLFWERLLRGEKINEEEFFVLSFQLLIEVLLLLKKSKRSAILHLCLRDLSLCGAMISYLKENRLMWGEVRCALFLDTPIENVLPLCRLSEAELLVLPELVITPSELGAPLASALRRIATVYPIGGLRFGRVLTESPSLALAAKQEAYERIDAFLLEEEICDEKRQEILNDIFNN